MSSIFTRLAEKEAQFDSRIRLGHDLAEVFDYFRWRQAEASQNFLNAWCYWTLLDRGLSEKAAAAALDGMPALEMIQLLEHEDIAFKRPASWQRNGVGIFWTQYEKVGYHPIQDKQAVAMRRHLEIDLDLPVGDGLVHLLEPFASGALPEDGSDA